MNLSAIYLHLGKEQLNYICIKKYNTVDIYK